MLKLYLYSFYGGYLLFRGHFNATGSETAVSLTVQGGFAFGYSAFLNGVFLGSNQGTATISQTSDTWTFPAGALKAGEDNVVVVLQGKLVQPSSLDLIDWVSLCEIDHTG